MKTLLFLTLALFSLCTFAQNTSNPAEIDKEKAKCKTIGDSATFDETSGVCKCVDENKKLEFSCQYADNNDFIVSNTSGDNIISSEKLSTCYENTDDNSTTWRTEGNRTIESTYFRSSNASSDVEILCNKDINNKYMYYKESDPTIQVLFHSDEKSPINVSNADIVDDPKVSCTKLWGGKPYLPRTESEIPTFPKLDYMCTMAEKSNRCSGITALLNEFSEGGKLVTEIKNGFATMKENAVSPGSEQVMNQVVIESSKNREGSILVVMKDAVYGKEGRAVASGNVNEKFFQPVVTINNVYGGAPVQMLACPEFITNNIDKINTIIKGSSDFNAVAYECVKELRNTVFGVFDQENGTDATTLMKQLDKVVSGGEAHFLSFVQCRNTEVAAIYENKIIPCRSLQSVAQINGYQDNSEEIQSFDGKFKCVKEDAFTADYKYCKRMIHTYNGIMATQSIAKSAEQISMGSANLKAQEKTLEDPTNIQKNALEGQKIIIDRTITHKYAEVGMHSTFASTMGGMLMSWPVPKNIHRKCDIKSSCCIHASANYYTRIYKNYGVKKMFLREVFLHMGKATAAGVLAHLWNQQKNKLKEYQDELDGLEAEEYIPQNSDLIVNHCMQDPNAPGCSNRPRDLVSNPALGQSAINFNGAGGTPVGVNASNIDPINYFSNDDDSDINSGDRARLNDMIADGVSEKGGFADPLPSAAKFSRGGGTGGGGGGGGGGGASAAGLGRAPSSNGGGKKDMVFGSGGGRSKKSSGFAYRGGGFGRKTSSKSRNPFDALKKGNGKGGVSHRGVASDISGKSSGLFKKISARYVKISGANRLMEYKQDE